MKRTILLVLMIVLVVMSGTITGCSCEEDGGETAQSEMEVKGLEIQVNRAYFAIVADWYENLIVETTLHNKGGEARYLNFFLPESTSLFLQDGDGTTYRNTQAFTSWKEGRDRLPEGNVDSLRLEPGEMRTLMLRFDDVPKDVDGLKLVCVLYTDREHRASAKVEIQGEPTNGESSDEPESAEDGQVYTSAPRNPEEPAEVLAAFWFWVSEGKEREAESFVAAEWISEYRASLDELEDQFGGKVQKVIAVETTKEGETAKADFILYLDGDGPENLTAYFTEENGEWKLNLGEDAGKKIYTEAPNNPETPGEVVAAFYFWRWEGGKKQELIGIIEESFREEASAEYDGEPIGDISKVKRLIVDDELIEGRIATVTITVEVLNEDPQTAKLILVLEDGEWRVAKDQPYAF